MQERELAACYSTVACTIGRREGTGFAACAGATEQRRRTVEAVVTADAPCATSREPLSLDVLCAGRWDGLQVAELAAGNWERCGRR